ncbi:unnamed protein product, partial [Ilex paraguariensis]
MAVRSAEKRNPSQRSGFSIHKLYKNPKVSGFLKGERDYSNLKGDTGPLVYPAGFLYIYSAMQFVTGGQVFPAQ